MTTLPEEHNSFQHDKPDESPKNPRIELEVLSGKFTRDRNSNIQNSPPVQIQKSPEGFTTVTRETVTTLYDNNGEVVLSVPTKYLRERATKAKHAPSLIETPEGTDDYLLISSSAPSKGCPVYFADENNIKIGDFVLAKAYYGKEFNIEQSGLDEAINFLDRERFWYRNRGYRKLQEDSRNLWENLIRLGKVQFVPQEKEEKLVHPSFPSLVSTKSDIKAAISSAEWIAPFPQKQSLFMKDGKLHLFDWTDEIKVNWSINELALPSEITEVTAAGLDPKDNFLLIGAGSTLYVVDHHKTPMQVVHKLEATGIEFAGGITLLDDGTILVGDKSGNLNEILSNFHTFHSRKERLEQERVLQRLQMRKRTRRFRQEQGTEEHEPVSPEIGEFAQEEMQNWAEDIENVTNLEEIESLRKEINYRKEEFRAEITNTRIVNAIFNPIFDLLDKKESEILATEVQSEIQAIRGFIDRLESMSLPDLATAMTRVDRVATKVLESGLTQKVKQEIVALSETFRERSQEVLQRDEEKLLKQLDDLFSKTKREIEAMTKLSEFELWENTGYEAFLEAISIQVKIVPASHTQVLDKLRKMGTDIRKLKQETGDKFKREYEEIRGQAAKGIDIESGIALDTINEFLETLREKVHRRDFRTKEEAKQWVERNSLYKHVLGLLENLETKDPEKADNHRRKLKVEVAQLVYQVKRLGDATVDAQTDRQMVTFGEVAFPVWEHRAEGEKKKGKIEVTYKVDSSTKGPGINPEDYMCELFYKVTDENGKVKEIPMEKDETRKYGLYNERFFEEGVYHPYYLPQREARKVVRAIKEKESNRDNETKRKYEEFQRRIKELSGRIKSKKEETGGEWDDLREERHTLTKEYVDFLHQSGLYGWFKFNGFKNRYRNGEDVTNIQGQGRVPDWNHRWVVDEQTEKYLAEIAEMAKISLEIRSGMISLEGHAGTGKDVLVEMFCSKEKTRRPLFTFECSKWTTEFDLSQDVTLESKQGASFTKMVDSIVVKALETPGAVLYFNEFNTLPLQAQTYLHQLLDDKRQMTLKTSESKVVKAEEGVLVMGSMNPGYPATNHPNPATRDRMRTIKIDFPEFRKTDGTYSPAEALRVARSVKSLTDLTIDPDMEENEFVKLWDRYINKGEIDENLTPERKFDLEVIFALITFAVQIREGFINKIRNLKGRKLFKISLPFTQRGLRWCATSLSHMNESKKQNPGKAEDVAKDLIRKFFAQSIFDENEAEELENHLATWTTQKPMHTASTP